MASVVIDVSKALLQLGAKKLYDDMTGNTYGDATQATKAIINAIEEATKRVVSELSSVIIKESYRNCTNNLTTWIDLLQKRLDAANRGVTGAKDALTAFQKDLKNANNGIDPILNNLNGILVRVSPDHNQGLIAYACEKLDNDFIDRNKPECDMKWYLTALDRYMANQIYWQLAGLALQLYSEREDKVAAERCVKAMQDRVGKQLEYAYNSCHPLIKTFRASYFDNITTDRYYWFQKCHDGKYLHIEGERDVQCLWEENGKVHAGSQWRFTAPIDQGGLSALENRKRPNDDLYIYTLRGNLELWFQPPDTSNYVKAVLNVKPIAKINTAIKFTGTSFGGILEHDFRAYRVS